MSFSFSKAMRLRTRRDFKRMAWQFTRQEGKFITLDVKNNQLTKTRLGITVTRRYGDSHLRNRFKRLVREAFRLCYPQLRKGIDLNIRPRRQALNATLAEIQSDFRPLFLSV